MGWSLGGRGRGGQGCEIDGFGEGPWEQKVHFWAIYALGWKRKVSGWAAGWLGVQCPCVQLEVQLSVQLDMH